MADIFSNPIAVGALTGFLDLINTGLDEKRATEVKAKKTYLENQGSFVDYLAGDSEAARLFIQQPSSVGMMANLQKTNAFGFQKVLLSASKKPEMSEIDKKVLGQMAESSTFAKNYLLGNPNLSKTDPDLYKFAVISGVGNSMTSSQSTTYNDLIKGGSDNVKQYMSAVFPPKVVKNDQGEIEERYAPQILNNSLFHSLNAFVVSKENEIPTVELSDTNINSLRDQLKDARPSEVPKLISTFKNKIVGELDFKSNAFLAMAAIQYGTKQGDAFKQSIQSLAKMVKDVDGTIEGTTSNQVVANTVKDIMKNKLTQADKTKLEALKTSDDPIDQETYTSYQYIKSLHNNMKVLGKAKPTQFVYGKNDFNSLIQKDKDPTSDVKAGLSYLARLDGKIKSGQFDYGEDLTDDKQKSDFITETNSVIQNIHLDAVSLKQVGVGANAKNEKGLPLNFNTLVPELMKIDGISNFVEQKLGLAKEGQDISYIMPPQTKDAAALPVEQLKLADNVIYQLSQETIEFANSKGVSPVELFKDKGYRNLITSGDGVLSGGVRIGSDEIFKKLTMLKNSGIVVGDTDITEKNARKLARFFVVNDIQDASTQYDMIAALKSERLPNAWANKEPFRMGLSASALEAGSKELAGQTYDVKKLPQLVQSSDAFASELEAVINYLEATPGKGSQFARDFYSFFLNQALLSGSTLDVVSGNIANLISVDTVAGNTVEEREAESGRLNQTFTEIMRSDFAKNNALINSTFISLAYNYARTKDPNGRISDADFKFAYNALTGGYTTPKQVSVSVLEEFLVEAKSKQALLSKVNEHFSRYDNNTNTVTIQKDNVRGLRALKDFKKISLLTRQVSNIKEYVKAFETNPSLVFGTNSRYTKKRTQLKNVAGQRLTGVYEVGLLSPDKRSSVPIAGSIPMYVKEDGTPLTLIELNGLRAGQ